VTWKYSKGYSVACGPSPFATDTVVRHPGNKIQTVPHYSDRHDIHNKTQIPDLSRKIRDVSSEHRLSTSTTYMSNPIEAQSISSLTNLLANPPQYPRNPTHQPNEALVLYIVRVPGSKGKTSNLHTSLQ
jgi:hypothetical protein